MDDDTIAATQQVFSRMDSEGQRLMTQLNSGDQSKIEESRR